MGAELFTKSATGLILASGLIAASSVMGYAQDGTVALGTQATVPLAGLYVSAPTGMATLGGHPFDLRSGNLVLLGNGQNVSFSGSWKNTQAVYLLLNTFNTYWWYQGSVIGQVRLTFSDGTTQSTALTVGGNVREWRTGSGFTVNTLSDPAAANVWAGTAQSSMGGGNAVIDMLTMTVQATGKTLTGIGVSDVNTWGALHVMMSGVTVNFKPFTRPGNSGNTPAALNSQAPQHANSANFTGQSPAEGRSANSANAGVNTPAATDQDKHTNRGNPAH